MVRSAFLSFRESMHAIGTKRLSFVVVCCVIAIGGFAVAQDASPSAPSTNAESSKPTGPSAEQISQWVQDLDSDRYIVRRTATDKLVTVGMPAIGPLVELVPNASLEAVTRSIRILLELAASNDYATGTAAFKALEKLAEQRSTAAARRAQAALGSMANYRRDRAVKYLKELGAVFETNTVRGKALPSRSLPAIRFGGEWKGTREDLLQLQLIVDVDSQYVEPMLINSKWLIIFDGQKFDDEWLKTASQLAGVQAIRIKKTKITGDGILHLRDLKDLEFIDIFYNPLRPEAVDRLSTVCEYFQPSKSLKIRLYGTELAQERVEQLEKKFNVEIDFKKGAFLGISCLQNQTPCRINYVGEGSAAQLGGLQIADVITKYNGVAIKDFDQLMQEIAKNVAGDKVPVVINRLGKQETKHVVLGEWDL